MALCAACGASNSERARVEPTTPSGTREDPASAALQEPASWVAAGLVCMLDPAHAGPDCDALARRLHVGRDALDAARPEAVDALSEHLLRELRARSSPLWQRVALTRWLDLGVSAVREATAARAGAACVEAPDDPSAGDPLDAVRSRAALLRRDALDALFDEVPSAMRYAAPVEASALLVLAHRVATARGACGAAGPVALRGLQQLLREQRARHAAAATGGGPPAGELPAAPDARAWITQRLGALRADLVEPPLAGAAARLERDPGGP